MEIRVPFGKQSIRDWINCSCPEWIHMPDEFDDPEIPDEFLEIQTLKHEIFIDMYKNPQFSYFSRMSYVSGLEMVYNQRSYCGRDLLKKYTKKLNNFNFVNL
jgi:hypothetical protein